MLFLKGLVKTFRYKRQQREQQQQSWLEQNIKFIIYFIQLFALIFHSSFNKQFQYQQTIYMENLISVLSIYRLLLSQTVLSEYVIYFTFTIFLYSTFALLLQLLYIEYRHQQNSGNINQIIHNNQIVDNLRQEIEKYLRIFLLYWQRVLLIPFQIILVKPLIYPDTSGAEFYTALINQLIIVIFNFMACYFLRNEEFQEFYVLEAYSLSNFAQLFALQGMGILYLFEIKYNDSVALHFFYILIILVHLFKSLKYFSFGFNSTQKLIISLCITSLGFESCLILWEFNENIDDQFLLLTYLLIFQISIAFSEMIYEKHMNLSIIEACRKKKIQTASLPQAMKYLHKLSMSHLKIDRIQLIVFITAHKQVCLNTKCPVRQNRKIVIDQDLVEEFILANFKNIFLDATLIKSNLYQYEIQILLFLSFLVQTAKNFVLTYRYCQDIQQFIQRSNMTGLSSFYFKLSIQITQEQCIQEISETQAKKKDIKLSEVQLQNEIICSLELEDNYLDALVEIILLQQNFWNMNLNNSIKSFNEILNQLERLNNSSNSIKQLKNQQQNGISIYYLRMQLYLSILMCDDIIQQITLALQIQQIEDSQLIDNQLSFFNNQDFINGTGIPIIGNLTTSELRMKETQLANYFKYPLNQQITKIEQLLPTEFANIHQDLIEAYIQRGQFKTMQKVVQSYVLTQQNYIQQCQVSLSNYFLSVNSDTFLMIAFLKRPQQDQLKNNIGQILVTEQLQIYGITQMLYNLLLKKQFTRRQSRFTETDIDDYHNQNLKDVFPDCSDFIIENVDNFKEMNQLSQKGIIYVNRRGKSEPMPVDYWVQEQIFHPLSNGQVYQKKFYEIEVEFDPNLFLESHKKITITRHNNDINQLLSPIRLVQEEAKTPTWQHPVTNDTKDRIETEKKISNLQEPTQVNQSMLLFSENNEQQPMKHKNQFLAEQSLGGSTRRSSNEVYTQIQHLNSCLNNGKYPREYKQFISVLIMQIIIQFTFILLLSLLFYEKKNAQSLCIYNRNLDIEYLNSYSILFSGSRNIYMARDAFHRLTNYSMEFNQQILNFTKFDLLLLPWINARVGYQSLSQMQREFKSMILKEPPIPMTLQYLDYDFIQVVTQDLNSRAEYNEILYQNVYLSARAFAKNVSMIVSSTKDSYQQLLARSIIFYNYFQMLNITNQKLDECSDFNVDFNNFIDELALNLFIGFYFLFFFTFLVGLYFLLKSIKKASIYLRFFTFLQYEDYLKIIDFYDILKGLTKTDRFLLSNKQFQILSYHPIHQLELIRLHKLKLGEVAQKRKSRYGSSSKKVITEKISTALLIILLLMPYFFMYIYGGGLQLYYVDVSNNIAPIASKAIQAEKVRIDFLSTITYWQTYLFKTYYQKYYELSLKGGEQMSENMKLNWKLSQHINVTSDEVREQIAKFSTDRISEVIFSFERDPSTQLSNKVMYQLGGGDMCELTGCDMNDLQDRPHFAILIEYFKNGLIQIEKTMNLIFKENEYFLDEITPENFQIYFNNLFFSKDHFLIFIWGMDAVLLQIKSFSSFLIEYSQQQLENVTQNSQLLILLCGICILLFSVTCQIVLYYKLIKIMKLAKMVFKLVPISILFQRNIPSYLFALERKHN